MSKLSHIEWTPAPNRSTDSYAEISKASNSATTPPEESPEPHRHSCCGRKETASLLCKQAQKPMLVRYRSLPQLRAHFVAQIGEINCLIPSNTHGFPFELCCKNCSDWSFPELFNIQHCESFCKTSTDLPAYPLESQCELTAARPEIYSKRALAFFSCAKNGKS